MMEPPTRLEDNDHRVICEIDDLHVRLRDRLSVSEPWNSHIKRLAMARAIRGSNSIEGYDVSVDDAVAMLDNGEPHYADRRTSSEIIGYRNALTFIHVLADDPHFSFDGTFLRAIHFMMLGHNLDNRPGLYRQAAADVCVRGSGRVVYQGPDHRVVPELMDRLVDWLRTPEDVPAVLRAAMAHLNLVMIHPFRDGNGRMARALQSLVLSRAQFAAPEFSSVEEWFGRHTAAYYEVLATVGRGSWNPSSRTGPWVKLNLAAHHMQAHSALCLVEDAARVWSEIDDAVRLRGLPDRTCHALLDAVLGLPVRRTTYARQADLDDPTAQVDLNALLAAGLLTMECEPKGSVYRAAIKLRVVRNRVMKDRRRPVSPY